MQGSIILAIMGTELEDQTVLKRSPDFLNLSSNSPVDSEKKMLRYVKGSPI